MSEIRVSEIRVSKIRVSKIRGSEIRGSEIRVSKIRISSNHRELHGAIFWNVYGLFCVKNDKIRAEMIILVVRPCSMSKTRQNFDELLHSITVSAKSATPAIYFIPLFLSTAKSISLSLSGYVQILLHRNVFHSFLSFLKYKKSLLALYLLWGITLGRSILLPDRVIKIHHSQR